MQESIILIVGSNKFHIIDNHIFKACNLQNKIKLIEFPYFNQSSRIVKNNNS